MTTKKISRNEVSLAGEFAVLSQLALNECIANMTLGYTKNIDILVFYPKKRKRSELEVKTCSTKPTKYSENWGGPFLKWQMQEKRETKNGIFYCFVHINLDKSSFRYFIVPGTKIADYVMKENREWKQNKGRKNKDRKETKMRQFRLGLEEFKPGKYKTRMLLAKNYENRWDLLKK